MKTSTKILLATATPIVAGAAAGAAVAIATRPGPERQAPADPEPLAQLLRDPYLDELCGIARPARPARR